MFDVTVFLLTLEKVAFLLLFIFIGYALRRKNKLNRDSAMAISVLTTWVFSPAYTVINLPKTFTLENLGSNALLIGTATLLVFPVIGVARFLALKLGRDGFERRTLSYMLAFSNIGYFGYPVVEGVFGDEVLAKFMVFCLPFNLAICSYGYSLFMQASGKKFRLGGVLLSPLMLGCYAGYFLGLTGLRLPSLLDTAFTAAGACMSPASMLLAGIVMGSFPLKKLLSGVRPYLLGVVRLLLIPLLFGIPLYLFGVRGIYLFLSLVIISMPSGMNIVVYPESLGQDASDNAKLCFVSTLMSLVTLPFVFSLIKMISGL